MNQDKAISFPGNVSVVIPTCDRNVYLPEAISSVQKQSVSNIEIIVVNNGQGRLPDGLVRKTVKVLDIPPYSGAAAARNAGAIAATGDVLAFLDDDDRWAENYLENLIDTMRTEKADCVFSTRVRFYSDGRTRPYKNPLPKKIPGPHDSQFYKAPGFGGTNFVIRRDTFLEIGGFDADLRTSEDQDLFVRLVRSGKKLATCAAAVCLVRHHLHPRLTDGAFSGTWRYYRKHRADAGVAQHWQFLLSLIHCAKKSAVRRIKRIMLARIDGKSTGAAKAY